MSVDRELINLVFELGGERTKKAAVTKALQEFVARRQQKRLLDLFGKLEWVSRHDSRRSGLVIELVRCPGLG